MSYPYLSEGDGHGHQTQPQVGQGEVEDQQVPVTPCFKVAYRWVRQTCIDFLLHIQKKIRKIVVCVMETKIYKLNKLDGPARHAGLFLARAFI